MNMFGHEYFMRIALTQAQIAFDNYEVPVGAIIVHQNKIIAKGHNLCEKLIYFTAHAEMQAITSAANFLGGKYLKGCTIYVTLEPCVMCIGGLYWSQLDRIVYAASDPKRGALSQAVHPHPKTTCLGGVMEAEAADLLLRFFQKKR